MTDKNPKIKSPSHHHHHHVDYVACHGPDGTLLTRPPGFGPTFVSHALSELRSLHPAWNSPPTSSTTTTTTTTTTNDDEWDGSPRRMDINHNKALEIAGRLVASELWEVQYASTASLEDLVQQVESGLKAGNNLLLGDGTICNAAEEVALTWNLGRHSWLSTSSSKSSPSQPAARDIKTAMTRIRDALSRNLQQLKKRETVVVGLRQPENNSDISTNVAVKPIGNHRGVSYVKVAAEAQHRFALFLYNDTDFNHSTADGDTIGAAAVTFAIAVQVGGCSAAKVCHEYQQRRAISLSSTNSNSNVFLTPTRPPLSLLMANLARVAAGDVVLDPFCGSGSLLWGASHGGASFCIGSDMDHRTSATSDGSEQEVVASCHGHHTITELLQSDIFSLPGVLRRRYSTDENNDASSSKTSSFFDAILTDPPYGLREDQSGTPDGASEGSDNRTSKRIMLDNSSQTIVAPYGGSQCYIEDRTGVELLESVSLMMQPVFCIAVQMLKPRGRLVYLLPLFPSQAEIGLWGTTGALGEEAVKHLPTMAGLMLVSAERHRCKKRGMARAIVVMERA